MKAITLSPQDVIDIVQTKKDAALFLSQLDQVSAGLFDSKKTPEVLFDTHLPYDKKAKLSMLLAKYAIDIRSPAEIQAFIVKVKEIMSQVPSVGIVMAFVPYQQLITMLSSWFTIHAQKAVLLEISVDETLIGGAIISHNGVVKDFSIKKQLHDRYKKGELHLIQ